MDLCRVFHQSEAPAKLRVQPVRIIAFHWQTTTAIRPFQAKRADDDMAARADCSSNLLHVCATILRRRQEMEHSSIMPEIEAPWSKRKVRYVRADPTYRYRAGGVSPARHSQGGPRNIHYRNVAISPPDQIFAERGFSTAHIKDRRGPVWNRPFDQAERNVKMGTVPTHRIGSLCAIDGFPVG